METLFRRLLRFVRKPVKTGQAFSSMLALLIGASTPAMAQEQATPVASLPLSISILYFDQSSHQLRPRVKATLDSMARILVAHSSLVAAVTGYSDTVGRRDLNIALAEQRAKTVATYLRRLGVPELQLIVNWEEPDPHASADESGAVKTIRRRVSLLLYPR